MEEDEVISDVKLKRLRNLKMFKGKTDEDIYEFYRNRDPQPTKPEKLELPPDIKLSNDDEYDKKFRSKLKALQTEYGVDMNESNDAEQLRTLVRLVIQQEVLNKQIIATQYEEEIDTRTLKNLGDYQRTLVQSVTDIQERLGIARKQRKEKQVDSVALFIDDLKKRGKEFLDKKTVTIKCEKDEIELVRYWLNFPENTELIHFEITCWKCGEKRIHKR